MKKIKVGIAEDNVFLQRALEDKLGLFINLEHRFTASNGDELLDILEDNYNHDLILMDIEMPKMNGIEATSEVKRQYPHIKIIMLTVFDNDENIFNAIRAGADGYLLKDTNAETLHNAILEVLDGGAPMTPAIARKTLKLLRSPVSEIDMINEVFKLSERETGVLEQLATGNSYTRIAETLFISPGTVRKHIENIYKKLKVHNKLEALEKARKHKLL